MEFFPEGSLLEQRINQMRISNFYALSEAQRNGDILEGRAVVCDWAHNLIVELGEGLRGIIPREEGALGIKSGETRDIAIISRVNKPVCFTVTGFDTVDGELAPILSRREAQQRCLDEYISRLCSGDVIPAKVTHLEGFGCFVDIGCGIPSMIPIDAISVSRISHPSDRFFVGQNIRAVVKQRDENGRICLTHKELLGTWLQNAAEFSAGETVAGIIRSIEPYGVFVELAPNLAGLAELKPDLSVSQHASVYIKSLIPQKMKVKLIIVDCFAAAYKAAPPRYFFEQSHMDRWVYSPEGANRIIETVFEQDW